MFRETLVTAFSSRCFFSLMSAQWLAQSLDTDFTFYWGIESRWPAAAGGAGGKGG